MKIRFQADADLKHAIIAGTLRRAADVDFRGAESVPLEGLDDPMVLGRAAEGGRILVSRQKKVSIGQAIESLVLLWEVLAASDLENRISLVPSLVIY